MPRRLREGLNEAFDLFQDGELAQASQKLATLNAEFPNHYDVLVLLTDVSLQQQDFLTYEWTLYQLNRLKPNNPEFSIGLAGTYMKMNRPALGLQAYEKAIKRWPRHPIVEQAQEDIVGLRAALLAEINEPRLNDDELFLLAVGHDEVRFFMSHNQLRQCKQAAEKLLKKHPNLVPVMNNLAQVYLIEGNYAQARHLIERVLQNEPENIHALAHLVRILYLSGDFDGAREIAERQAASSSQAPERWVRMAETYSLLDEKERLLALYEQAQRSGELDHPTSENALLRHHVAVTLAGMGEEQQARRLWEEASQILPSFRDIHENLADLDKPAGERNGPWAYGFTAWVTESTKKEMVNALRKPVNQKDSAGTEKATRQFLQQYPGLSALLPHFLARGDAHTREFAIRLMKMAETPELVAMLKDFALGDIGTDEMRLDTAQFLVKQGHLASGSHRMWVKGNWTNILQLNFEITSEPIRDSQSPVVTKLASQAIEALYANDGPKAQALLEEALSIEETPSMLNNLALALETQGKTRQAHTLVAGIHARFPDYFFGISAEARKATAEGDFDKAHALLDRLLQRNRMHITEYDALCEAQIELALAREHMEAARSWLKMWEQVNPDAPRLMEYRLRLELPNLPEKMRSFLKK
jgi:tetratricopeptide (TPR) repeat protein